MSISIIATACPQCGTDAPTDARFCEACGARLTPIAEVDAGIAAGLTNPGLVKHANEDALYLKRDGNSVVAVICDGVSSSVAADAAARVACAAAGGELSRSLTKHEPEVAMRDAAAAAQRAVLGVPWAPQGGLTSPSCTFVAAVWDGRQVTVGSLGDSRAYWIDDEAARQLTTDDTWVQEQVDAERMTALAAQTDRRAHEITRWLGEDTPDGPPAIVTFVPVRPGRLAVCSDGLWNYAPTANAVAQLVRATESTGTPLTIARALVDHALAAGGHDNITVVVIDVIPTVEGIAP
jgi:serine/threonine protein phosphatase PrpC